MSSRRTAALIAELMSDERINVPLLVVVLKYVLMIVLRFDVCDVTCFIRRISALAGHVSLFVAS